MVFIAVVLASVFVNVLQSNTSHAQGGPPAPTFHVAIALDELGNVIPGASYEAWSCTSGDGEPGWMCYNLSGYDWFNPGLANTGVSTMALTTISGADSATPCSDGNVQMFIALRQTSAISGYTFSDGWNIFCLAGNGWISDDVQLVDKPIYAYALNSDGVYISVPPPLSPPPKASLAPGVTVSTAGTFLDADGSPTISHPITFGGLLGATAAAKIPSITPAPVITPSAPTTPTLANTGSDGYAYAAYCVIMLLGSIWALTYRSIKYRSSSHH